MSVETIIEDARWDAAGLDRLARAATDCALRHLGHDPESWDIALLGCDDARIAALNTDFRGKPQATNVLSWPSGDRAATQAGDPPLAPNPQEPELGDIAIAYETCAHEAKMAGKPFDHHVSHLVVHGLLHLLGYDHVRDQDATLMEAHEVAILGKMGLPDPYTEY